MAIQSKIETWTYWMMVTGAASAVFAFLGFLGVMMTLREQRRLTHSQEAALLQIEGIQLNRSKYLSASYRWEATVIVSNLGRTPAIEVKLRLEMGPADYSDRQKFKSTVENWSWDTVPVVPSGARREFRISAKRDAKYLADFFPNGEPEGSLWRMMYKLTYKDVFNRTRSVVDYTYVSRPAEENVDASS